MTMTGAPVGVTTADADSAAVVHAGMDVAGLTEADAGAAAVPGITTVADAAVAPVPRVAHRAGGRVDGEGADRPGVRRSRSG